ncbi:MAG: HAD family phosphatase [Planctomycetaceae bacterium]|nr:HAD family phosphatase [Planctomycetaceae bacterium]
MAIRTCFFDMGNVLVYFSHDRMCENIARVCDWDTETTRRFLLDDGRQWKLERGEITEEQFHSEFEAATGRAISIDELKHAAADIFWLNESILPVLRMLSDSGMRLILLSNTSVTHLRFIEAHFDVLGFMHDRVTSWEVGALKPEPEIFEAALARAQCSPGECFYTDDIQAYIDQATTMGINARLYTDTPNLIQDLTNLGVTLDS